MHSRPDFDDATHARLYELALPHLSTRSNEVHTNVALHFARLLLAREAADPQVVVPAVILHDIGWIKVPEDKLLTAFGPKMKDTAMRDLHEAEGASMAWVILGQVDYPEALAEKIAAIVARHDSYVGADSPEEALVKDADKLWRYSRKGVEIDSARFGLEPSENLRRLNDYLDVWFLTATGRALAREEFAAREVELAGILVNGE